MIMRKSSFLNINYIPKTCCAIVVDVFFANANAIGRSKEDIPHPVFQTCFQTSQPAFQHFNLFKINNENTRTMCKVCRQS